MTQIPFIEALGDSIETAIADHMPAVEPETHRAHRRRRILRGRRLVLALVAVVMLGGAVAVAAHLLTPTRSLVAGGIACYEGTNTNAAAYFDIEANGRTPQDACRGVFATGGPSGLGAPSVRLTPCATPHGYVAVFKATGSAEQCQQFGMSPINSAAYAAAAGHVATLVRDLRGIWMSRDCIPTRTLVADAQGLLNRRGWSGWRATAGRSRSPGGRCGMFTATGSTYSDPAASLDPQTHTLSVDSGPSRSAERRLGLQ